MRPDREPHHVPSLSWREAALWGAAGLVVVCVYAGAGFSLMQERPEPAKGAAVPDAIMIDLAPPPAPPAPLQKVAIEEHPPEEIPVEPPPEPQKAEEAPQDQVEQPEIEPPAPPVTEPETKVETPDPKPETPAPAEKIETAEKETSPLDNVEVPLPTPRPPAPTLTARQQKTPPKHEVRLHKRAASHASERPPSRADRASAPARGSTHGSRQSTERWQARLLAHLERHKRYPASARARREEGTVQVRFRIDPSGKLLSVSLVRSSGFADLDAAVVAMVRRSSPMPAPPPGVNRTILVPIRFSLR